MGYLGTPGASLAWALAIIGFTATASQVILIRELLVVFHGNELFLGIIFGTWLLLEAVGSYAARGIAERTARPLEALMALQVAVGVAPLASILALRSFRYLLGIPVGELLGAWHVAMASLLTLTPVAILDGALFPVGCRNLADVSRREEASARTYLYQAFGAFAAGAALALYLLHLLNPIQLALLIFALNLCPIVYLLASVPASAPVRYGGLGILAAACLSLFTAGPGWLERKGSELLWYEYDLVDTRQSVYSHLAVTRDKEQLTFFANGSPYATTPVPGAQIEELVHFPMLIHAAPQSVVVIGGGAGGVLREVLKYPVREVHYVEQDPLVIEQFRRLPTALTERELADPRTRIHLIEGRLFLRTTDALYDVILVNLPVASTLTLNRFYTVEFFRIAKSRVREQGILALRLPGSETFLSEELKQLNRRIYGSLRAVFPHVRIIIGEQNIFLASGDPAVDRVGAEVLTQRLGSRAIRTDLITAGYLQYKTDARRFRQLEQGIAGHEGVGLNTDMAPKGVVDGMLLLSSAVSPLMAQVLEGINRVPVGFYLGGVSLLLVSLVAAQVAKRGQMFLTYAVGSTGFTSMLLSILLVFSFQIHYGHVYHYIGLLTSLFMLGSGVGAWWAVQRRDLPLIRIEMAMALLTGLAYLFVSLEPGAEQAQLMIVGLMIGTGVLTGLQYPVAVHLADRSYRRVSATAGRLYAVDLGGAVLGAVLTAVVLIPGIGLKDTILLAGLIKAGSVILVYAGMRTGYDRSGGLKAIL